MAVPDHGGRGRELRARLDAFRETEALAGAGIDELRSGLERACARVNGTRPEATGADRLNPQHWGYALYVYFRDRILIGCTILPVVEADPQWILLRIDVNTDSTRRAPATLTLERTAPARAEWRSEGRAIDPETFFLDLLERYASKWA